MIPPEDRWSSGGIYVLQSRRTHLQEVSSVLEEDHADRSQFRFGERPAHRLADRRCCAVGYRAEMVKSASSASPTSLLHWA